MIVDESMPVLYQQYNISKDSERHGIGGASSGAIVAFTVAWQRDMNLRGSKMGGAILPDRMGWLWRDHELSVDPKDMTQRSLDESKKAGKVDPT